MCIRDRYRKYILVTAVQKLDSMGKRAKLHVLIDFEIPEMCIRDSVELIYGIDEMGCINNGTMPLKQLAPLLYKIFGLSLIHI